MKQVHISGLPVLSTTRSIRAELQLMAQDTNQPVALVIDGVVVDRFYPTSQPTSRKGMLWLDE